MMRFLKVVMTTMLVVGMTTWSGVVHAQFLKANGKKIIDGNGNEVIWRGIGLGGWMLQEGYMLQTGGPQYKIEARIETLVGAEKKDQFYDAWLANHTRKIDVDSLASWGYNMIRLPMHYKLFTPPIEDEPVAGQITWRDKGFTMVDDLLDWCKANNIYLILDLHAAPGGQGENADINDYDTSKPSLWESEANKEKMIALWRKLADRYKDEPMIGGYDIINEPNWGFQNHGSDPNGCSESQNTALWNLEKAVTAAIREVDKNHIIIIEGNCWGNNYSGLPALWDNNLVISYHKYWNGNDKSSIQGMLDMRTNRNVPIWLGETGENSNSWFTDCVNLLETNGIGWAWWPLKKLGGNNPLQIPMSSDYKKVIDYWSGGTKPSVETAFRGLMAFAENTKLENNIYKPDVVDAVIRQPHTNDTKPFEYHVIKPDVQNVISASDYDLGKQGFAYSDKDYTNTSGGAGGATWNNGGAYRNDGVDIETSTDTDPASNGYNVGWTENGEWMQYTVQVDSTGGYSFSLRYSGPNKTAIHLLVDGMDVTGAIELTPTGGYQVWETKTIEDVILQKGVRKLKIQIEKGGSNLGYFGFFLTKEVSDIDFKVASGQTDEAGKMIQLIFNKSIKSGVEPNLNDFNITVDGVSIAPSQIESIVEGSLQLALSFAADFYDDSEILLSYSGGWIFSEDGSQLATFNEFSISNGLPFSFKVPTKIEAEDFFKVVGMVTEECKDTGGGLNIGYTDSGDYLEFYVSSKRAGFYTLEVRTAAQSKAGKLGFEQRDFAQQVLNSSEIDVPVTGGWQSWVTSTTSMTLDEGRSILRVKVLSSGFNLNWFRFTENPNGFSKLVEWNVYPNPTNRFLNIVQEPGTYSSSNTIRLLDLSGKEIWSRKDVSEEALSQLDLGEIPSGQYLIRLSFENLDQTLRVVIEK